MASRILFISQDSLNISNKVEITANAVSHQTISRNLKYTLYERLFQITSN